MNEQSEESEEADEPSAGAGTFLTTSRLILRRPETADATAIAHIANNPRIAEQTRRMPHPYSERDAIEWIEKAAEAGDCAFLATLKKDGMIVGAAGSAPMEEDDTEVGYWIGEAWWGNGYATEAVQAVVDHTFTAKPLERLYGRCRVANGASRRVLVKCGFQLIGSGMCDSRVLNGLVPVEEFVLERSVWVSLKSWGKAS